MTKRMIELYKEAADFAYNICKDEGRAGGPSDHIWNTVTTGRFAELIVRECALHLHQRGVEGFGILEERDLKEHFGIKE